MAPIIFASVLIPWAAGCRSEALDPVPPGPEATGTSSAAVAAAAEAARTSSAAARPDPRRRLEAEGLAYLDVRIERGLEPAVTAAIGDEVGRPLAQVLNRALVWWVTPHTDLRPGDRVEAVYQLRPPEEPVVRAVWFRSEKLGRELVAVRYQPGGAPYARWFEPDGKALERALVDTPIRDYEQITSLINDGRRHKGVDFKAAVGTPVYAPFDGVVERRNWGRANGTCVDLADAKRGLNAYFLHLSEIDPAMTVGARVKKGQRIGLSGNTGHSTAPHLHYQLVRGKTVMDPFRVHATEQHRAPAEELPKLQAELSRLAQMRNGPHAQVGDL